MLKFNVRKGDVVAETSDMLVLGVWEDKQPGAFQEVNKRLKVLLSEIMKEEGFEGKEGQMLTVRPGAPFPSKRVLVVGLGKHKQTTEETMRQMAANAFNAAKASQAKRVAIALVGAEVNDLSARLCAKAAAEGVLLAAYNFAKYKSEVKEHPVETVDLLVDDAKQLRSATEGFRLGEAYARGTMLARNLINVPAHHMRPIDLVNAAKDVAKKSQGKVLIKVYDKEQLEKMGAGGMLGVSRGSDHDPYLVHLTYKPAKAKKRIAFVGKAVTFDSGGISLKPADAMMTMKCDMSGAAAVIGAFSTLAELQPAVEIHGVFGAVENMPSGKAIVPGDVLTAMNGKTMEVLNTDAEGRLTLADTLTFAQKQKPDMMMDLATLTGACIIALGEEIAGVLSNNQAFAGRILGAAKQAGENMWQLPLEPGYKKLIQSEVADVKNIGGRPAGAITAGLFLQEFVDEKLPWAHLDIAGPAFAEKPLNAYTKHGGTGFGVRTLLELVRSF